MKSETERVESIRRAGVPNHVALIMDGNGRWAKQRGLPRMRGYPIGMEALGEVCRIGIDVGVGIMTLFVFSRANWKRPPAQVEALMDLLEYYAASECSNLKAQGIRVEHIGELSGLPASTARAIERTCELTASCDQLRLVLALNYGGRWEITRAVRAIARDIDAGRLCADEIDEDLIASRLTTAPYPDPDLIVRTSGEQRISDFLLWQLAFSELYLTDVLWPDFRAAEFLDALESFQRRERTFGALPASERAG